MRDFDSGSFVYHKFKHELVPSVLRPPSVAALAVANVPEPRRFEATPLNASGQELSNRRAHIAHVLDRTAIVRRETGLERIHRRQLTTN